MDFRVAEIDLRLLEQGLRLQHVGLCGLFGSGELIDGRLRNVLIFHQGLRALQLQIGIDLGRLCLGEIGVLLVDCGLVGVLLDAKQKIALFDQLPFGEIALFDETRDACDNVDFVDRHDTADEIAGFRHLSTDHRCYRDCGWRWSTLRHAGGTTNEQYERANRGCLGKSAPGASHPDTSVQGRGVRGCTEIGLMG